MDSLGATQGLLQQQLQDRLDTAAKQNSRWRQTLEDALRALSADVQALKVSQARQGAEPLPEHQARDIRRMLEEREEATRRQLDTLGRAIHSLADSVNVASPLVISSSAL